MTGKLAAWILAFAAFAIVPVAVLAEKGEMVVLGLAGAVLLVQAAAEGIWRAAFRTPVAGIFLSLLVWALVTSAWAISTPAALDLWKSLALIFAAILLSLNAATRLNDEARQHVATWAVVGLGLGLVILGIELTFTQPLTRLIQSGDAPPRPSSLNAGISVALAIVWPVAAAVWRRGQATLAGGLVAGVALAVYFSDGTSAKIAFVVALAAYALVWIARRGALGALCLIAALMILAAPVALRTIIPAPQSFDQTVSGPARSALHRLYIWDFAAQHIVEKPFLGWGLDSARALPGGKRSVLGNAPVMSLHPHNGALQIWLELGALGAALAALLILVIGSGIRRMSRSGQATSAAALFGALTIAGLSFGIWQNWWMAALGLIAVLNTALNPGQNSGQGPDQGAATPTDGEG